MARKFDPRAVGVSLPRKAPIQLHPFSRYFTGFENVPAVRRTFGPRAAQILKTVKVEFFSSRFPFAASSRSAFARAFTSDICGGNGREGR